MNAGESGMGKGAREPLGRLVFLHGAGIGAAASSTFPVPRSRFATLR
jgi:hypothetical protein